MEILLQILSASTALNFRMLLLFHLETLVGVRTTKGPEATFESCP